jgi:PAS domain S-box-containing protein
MGYDSLPDNQEFINSVTGRARLEEELRQSREFLSSVLDGIGEGVVVMDRDFRILTANNGYLNQVGSGRGQVVGRCCYEVSHRFDSPCAGNGHDCPVQRVFETGAPARAVHIHFDGLGRELHVECHAYPVRDSSGRVIRAIETLNNVTDRVKLEQKLRESEQRDAKERKKEEAERRKLQAQLYQSQKLEALGTLAGGIAHDFNNLLASILGYASLAKTDLSPDDPLYRNVDIIETASLRASELTQQLLAFAKGGKYDAKRNDVNAIVREVAALLSRTLDKNISLNLDCGGDLRPVVCDAGQIQQALLNICINGRDAMPQGGTLSIRTESVRLDIKDVQYFVDVPPGDYVRISVSDTGMGMDKRVQQHMFEPFFTTKEKGTGLGLSLVYGIIKKHSGFLEVQSEPGRGAMFQVNLVACIGEETCVEKRESGAVRRGAGTILVVDDEQMVAELTRDILVRFGYSALIAHSGEEAVKLYRQRQQDISAVVLDMAMPVMDGREVFHRLRSIDSRVKVIITSGYSHDRDADDLLQRGASRFVQKPYRMDEFVRAVGEVVGE